MYPKDTQSTYGVYKKRSSIDSDIIGVSSGENGNGVTWNKGSTQSPKVVEDFDDLLTLVGSRGTFQKTLLYCVLLPVIALLPLFCLNVIFMLSEPDHWCRVNGRDNLTSLEAWKTLTIPREIGPDGHERFSQCLMFDTISGDNRSRIACTNGWDYDRTDYQATIPTEYDWVCEKSDYTTQAFTAYSIGGAVGTMVFGWAGDRFGRKKVFFVTSFITCFFRLVSLYLAKYFYAFLGAQFLCGTAFPMLYISLFTIAAEISDNEYRAWIYGANWIIWVIGICLLPLLAWFTANWYILGILTSAPGFIVFLYWKMIPESPRWLLSKNRLDDAQLVLIKIAKKNGTIGKVKSLNIVELLQMMKRKSEGSGQRVQGVWTLFTRKRVALNTILLSIVWSMNGLAYYGITLNTTSMAGNQFLNFFILSIIELPTGWIGGGLAGKVGRRWTQVLFFAVCVTGFAIAAVGRNQFPDISWLIIVAVVIAKFGVAITSLIVSLQATEIFPTELRSTGAGFASTVGGIFSILSPYIVYLGRHNAAIPYIGMTVVSVIGMLSSSFLPETLKQTLPETMDDAENLGAGNKYWSYLPKDCKVRRASMHGMDNLGSTQDEK